MIVSVENWAHACSSTRKRRAAFPAWGLPRGLLAGVTRVRGQLRLFPGRAVRRRWLRRGAGDAGVPVAVSEMEGQVLLTGLASAPRGIEREAGSSGVMSCPGDAGLLSGRPVLWPEVGREKTGLLLDAAPGPREPLARRARRPRCEGPAWRTVRQERPAAFSSRSFTGSEGVGSAAVRQHACGEMATSARTRRLLLIMAESRRSTRFCDSDAALRCI